VSVLIEAKELRKMVCERHTYQLRAKAMMEEYLRWEAEKE